MVSRLKAAVDTTFPEVARSDRARLVQSAHDVTTIAVTAAIVLGRDLWRGEVLRWRNEFCRITPPPLWRFAYTASAQWPTQRWTQLNLDTRIFRFQVGALAGHIIASPASRARSTLRPAGVRAALTDLAAVGLLVEDRHQLILEPIAPAAALATDLTLVEIIANWLSALRNADLVAARWDTDECEIAGYGHACARCREHWGIKPWSAAAAPPFHPGCRCFVQARYASAPRPQ